jgi:hypothetical protein
MNIRQPIHFPSIKEVIVDTLKETYSNVIVNGEGINIFNELNNISIRFENEEVFK